MSENAQSPFVLSFGDGRQSEHKTILQFSRRRSRPRQTLPALHTKRSVTSSPSCSPLLQHFKRFGGHPKDAARFDLHTITPPVLFSPWRRPMYISLIYPSPGGNEVSRSTLYSFLGQRERELGLAEERLHESLIDTGPPSAAQDHYFFTPSLTLSW